MKAFLFLILGLTIAGFSNLSASNFDRAGTLELLARIERETDSHKLQLLFSELPHPRPVNVGGYYEEDIPYIIRTKVTDLTTFLSFGLWVNYLTSNGWPMDDGTDFVLTIQPIIRRLAEHAGKHDYFGIRVEDRDPRLFENAAYYFLARKYGVIGGGCAKAAASLAAP